METFKKISIYSICALLAFPNISIAQVENENIKLFDEFIGAIDMQHFGGVYEEPITYNQNTLDMGGMSFVDYGEVTISYDEESKSGKIIYHEYNKEVIIKIEDDAKPHDLSLERIKLDPKLFKGKILSLNETTLRILYLDRVDQLQLEEFIRVK